MNTDVIRSRMNEKTTKELTNIIINEKNNYTEETLEVIEEILDERETYIPPNLKKVIKSQNINLETRYRALRTISGFIKFAAYFALFLAILIALSIADGSIGSILIVIILAIIILIPYLAFSEIIELFTDLEENTRKTNVLLEKLLDKKI